MGFHIFIIAWIAAILTMTGFSALITQLLKRELREHLLLAQLLHTYKGHSSGKPSVLIGWIVHFAFGLFFMACYELLWMLTDVIRSLWWSIIFGMLIGLVGIMGWKVMFKIHPKPPELHFKTFYIQLFFAHIIFSVTAFLIYWFFK
ncbi:hypothetical protein QRD02_07030 [Aequorivita sp. SDUM287046]|uniref:DUF2938 domain-containing protein n=1 Tax=Aequorivita aurantiaca TaxID=3053356 RepID=A0ABT8DLX3_9FLAO|nr:hypothetical protein [Aequorivita aurantiaca]MDN3724130.1 hypothetical protein [Aequorivita aurantiaca]